MPLSRALGRLYKKSCGCLDMVGDIKFKTMNWSCFDRRLQVIIKAVYMNLGCKRKQNQTGLRTAGLFEITVWPGLGLTSNMC